MSGKVCFFLKSKLLEMSESILQMVSKIKTIKCQSPPAGGLVCPQKKLKNHKIEKKSQKMRFVLKKTKKNKKN